MAQEFDQLRDLLAGELESAEAEELETKLEARPELRRMLADMAVEAERPTAGAVRLQRSPAQPPTHAESSTTGPLGKGGMAVVLAGRQLKLDRAVAVKTLRADRRSEADVRRLLHEARITGRLEHPNIVPVHDIVRDEDGLPKVVLKLIEGHTWTELIAAPDRVRELFGADDLLEWNLGVLMAVARALSFAHSRHVLHRDVKPSNVMVGAFGEVYLLDWGIALDLDAPSNEDGGLDLAGTTGYMAPEQVLGIRDQLGTWTDTYLLAATLYHALAGRPPHGGVDLTTRVTRAAAGEPPPDLPDHVPSELRRITLQALHSNIERRTQHPEELRLALVAYLRHRGAERLARRGTRELESLRSETGPTSETEWEQTRLAAELAFRAAFEEWPECEEARRGLRELAIARITHALERGQPGQAARLLDDLDDPPEALKQQVNAARTEADEEAERLQRIVADADRGVGHGARGIFGAIFGLIWIGFWGVVAFVPPKTVAPLVLFTVGFAVIGITGVLTLGKQLLQNRINRTSMAIIVSGMAMTVAWCLGASWLNLEIRTVFIGLLLVWATFASGMATLMDPWGTISAVGFVGAFLVASYEPDWMPWALLAGNAVLIVNQIVLNIALARRGFRAPPRVPLGHR
ncbi:MAG: serine/threonine-protein kinase [Polyangiaceae bacterium]